MTAAGSLAVALVTVALAQTSAPPANPKGSPQPAPLRVLRVAAGAGGAESGGRFVLTEERSIFSTTTDREVVVHFEWDGSPGPHRLAAQWRSPDAGLTTTSAIDYVARDRRFGAYWRLPLTPSMPSGLWSIEATVDGQFAGRFAFELRTDAVQSATNKRRLAPPELYEKLSSVFLLLERSDGTGRILDHAAGFMQGGHLYTALSAIDAAESVHAVGRGGSRAAIAAVLAFDRPTDWAVLQCSGSSRRRRRRSPAREIQVGDRCFSMEGPPAGGRVLIEGTVNGYIDGDRQGRLVVSFLTGTGTPGAPLLNDFGELIGVVGGAGATGATRLMDLMRFRALLRGVPVTPLSLVNVRSDASPRTIAQLHTSGETVLPLVREGDVLSSGFAREIARTNTVAPADQRAESSSREKEFVAFVTWLPRERLRGSAMLLVYDSMNRVVKQSIPMKLNVGKGDSRITSWKMPIPESPGVYRADVLVDGKPISREFVRITP